MHADTQALPDDADLVEWYYERGFSDGLPVVPPTPGAVDAMVGALGGDPEHLECRVPGIVGVLLGKEGGR